MAKGKQEGARGVDPGDGGPAEEKAAVEVADFLAQFENAFKVVLNRRPTPLADEEYLGTFPIAGFDRDIVRDIYGGGLYRFTLKDANGAHIKSSSQAFRIGGAPIYPPRAPAAVDGGGVAVAAGRDPLMLEILTRLDRMERERAPALPAANPVEQFAAMATALKAIGFMPAAPVTTPVDQVLDAMWKGAKFQRDMFGDGQGNAKRGPYDQVAEAFGKPMGKLVDHIINQAAQRRELPPSPPRATESAVIGSIPSATAAAHPPTSDTMPSLTGLAKLQAFIPKIQRWAHKAQTENVDAYARAILILEKQDDETCTAILEALEEPGMIEQIIGYIPLNGEAEQGWVRELLEEMRDELRARAADGDEGEGEDDPKKNDVPADVVAGDDDEEEEE